MVACVLLEHTLTSSAFTFLYLSQPQPNMCVRAERARAGGAQRRAPDARPHRRRRGAAGVDRRGAAGGGAERAAGAGAGEGV